MGTATTALDQVQHERIVSSPRRRHVGRATGRLAKWDVAVIVAAFCFTNLPLGWSASRTSVATTATVMLVMSLGVLALNRAYSPSNLEHGNRVSVLGRMLMASAVAAWVTWLLTALIGTELSIGRMAAISLILPLGWSTARWFEASRIGRSPERVLLLGSGQVARHFVALTERFPERGMQVVGCLDDDPGDLVDGDPNILGGVDDLGGLLDLLRVDRVIACFSRRSDMDLLRVLRECDRHQVSVGIVPRLFDLMGPETTTRSFGGLSLIDVPATTDGRGSRIAKRALDIVGSLGLLIVFSPLLIGGAIAVAVGSGRPIVFRQQRVGRDGRLFSIVKFRTMVLNADSVMASRLVELESTGMSPAAAAATLKRLPDPRITRVGHFLRRTSIDELPQLWNVLRGEMSLVGPRPLCSYEVDVLDGWQRLRQGVRPGLTGLWQIQGRSSVPWEERMQMDYTYVRHWSVGADLSILARTVGAVTRRRGAV